MNMVKRVLDALCMPSVAFSPSSRTRWIQRSNERPNLYYGFYRMQRPANSFGDLSLFVPRNLSSEDPQPTPFIIYFNSRNYAMLACKWARARVSPEMRRRYVWVHAGMSDEHKTRVVAAFDRGDLLGVFSTESLGMVRKLIQLARFAILSDII